MKWTDAWAIPSDFAFVPTKLVPNSSGGSPDLAWFAVRSASLPKDAFRRSSELRHLAACKRFCSARRLSTCSAPTVRYARPSGIAHALRPVHVRHNVSVRLLEQLLPRSSRRCWGHEPLDNNNSAGRDLSLVL